MTKELYVLSGQSNMVGRAPLTPAPTYSNISRITRYSQPWDATFNKPWDSSNPGNGSWGAASDPLHSLPVAQGGGVGPGIAFADRLIDLRNDANLEIGLVPCAAAGSSIDSDTFGVAWDRGYRFNCYGSMVARTWAAQEAGGTLKGLLWYQGEAEALQTDYPIYWLESFLDLITKFRVEFGQLDLPVVAVSLGPNPSSGYPMWAAMQGYISGMAGISKHLNVVSAADLSGISGDPVHLDQASQITLGHRLADAMHAMQ